MKAIWRWGRWPLLIVTVAVVAGIGFPALEPLFYGEAGHPRSGGRTSLAVASAAPIDPGERATAQALSRAFAAAAEEVLPSVVTITSLKVIRFSSRQDPFWRFFHNNPFFDAPQERQIPQRGLGSGVIVREDGVILTNNHVVDQAEEISVTLADGRQYEAEVVGRDPKTDLAVIRIKEDEDVKELPVARLGDSEQLHVGDWVIAAGSPFQLQQTVTAGIVSAKGRSNLGIVSPDAYEDFIQTDAAINPGNSGGALVNLDGEVVGINTAIATRSGGYQGIGFAIPIDMARQVMESILEHGRVIRGQLGVIIQNVTPELADALGMESPRGALVSQVMEGSAAERAGIRERDVILALNDKPVKDVQDLRFRIAGTPPGTEVDLVVLRDGKERTMTVVLDELIDEEAPAAAVPETREVEERLGLELGRLTESVREELELDEDVTGVVVQDVEQGAAAAQAGLRPGDVIQEVGDRKIESLSDFKGALEEAPDDKPIVLRVLRGSQKLFLAMAIPKEK